MNNKRRSLQVGLKLSGSLLTLVAVCYVVWQSWHYQIWHEFQDNTLGSLTFLLVSSLLCVGGGVFLALAWWYLLISRASLPHLRKVCFSIYTRTQIGKYLPGNVLHIAWRYALGQSIGIKHSILIWGTILELPFVMSAAILIALPGASQWLETVLGWSYTGLLLILGSLLLFPLGVNWGLNRFEQIAPSHDHLAAEPIISVSLPTRLGSLSLALICYVNYFLVTGLACSLLVGHCSHFTVVQQHWLSILSIVSIAWIAGFVTPGASAGIGIRETALILALSTFMAQEEAISTAVLYRFSTTLGDGGTWLIGLLTHDSNSKIIQSAKSD